MPNSNGKWTSQNIPDQTEKVAVVTGANSGIGFYTAKALAEKNAQVVLAVRNTQKGKAAAQEIRLSHPKARLEVLPLDLSDLETVWNFAAAFHSRFNRLDLLVNNAGVMGIPYRKTNDGFETTIGVNHFGHFALTGLLLDSIVATPAARVVTVSSGMHRLAKASLAEIIYPAKHQKWTAYANSKLANLLFAYELQRRFETNGLDTISLATHPGYAATNLQSAGPAMEGNQFVTWAMKLANQLFAQSAEMGSLPILYAATAETVLGGDYIGPEKEARGYPVKTKSSPISHNPDLARQLWDESVRLTGINYDSIIHRQAQPLSQSA